MFCKKPAAPFFAELHGTFLRSYGFVISVLDDLDNHTTSISPLRTGESENANYITELKTHDRPPFSFKLIRLKV
jgi:hypothetical protein